MNKPFHKRSHGIFIATFRNTSANGRSDNPGTRQKHPVWTAGSDRGPAAAEEGRTLNFGYYAHFAPVSHSGDEDPASDGYNTHVGYEADLLTALEGMKGANLTFSRKPISLWDGIWLKPAGPEYDIVGGGITILDTRTRNAEGDEVVVFTSGHIAFRPSLLVRVEDADRRSSHRVRRVAGGLFGVHAPG